MANEQAKAFVDQATQSLQNSQFQQALDLVDQAIAIEPGASDSHVLRGICLSQLGQPDAATDAFRKAIMLSPYNAKAYYNLAVHYNALGNKKEAAELAREAVGVDPRHAAAKQFLIQLEAELSGPARAPTGVRDDAINPYDTIPTQSSGQAQTPPAEDQRPASGLKQSETTSQSSSAGAQNLPPPAASDMPHVSAAPGQTRPAAPIAPTGSPYAQASGGQFSPGGYTRPGYEQSAHSLPWIENMGGGWAAIGWVLSGVSLVLMIIAYAMAFSMIQSMFTGAGSHAPGNISTNYNAMMMNPLGIVGLFVRVLCLLWIILDIVDRRAGWGWVVALVILGCCCGVPWLIIPIYLVAGRKVL